jgi:hypothetical protein
VHEKYRHPVFPEHLYEPGGIPYDILRRMGLRELCGYSLLQINDNEGGCCFGYF